MRNCTRLLVAGLAAWALSTGPAWGNIVNGDFDANDSVGWVGSASSLPVGDYTEASAKIEDYQMKMHVSNSYVPGSGELLLLSQAEFAQNVIGAGGFAPAGTGALQFDADVEIAGAPNVNVFAEARVQVTYSTATDELVESWATVVSTGGVQPITVYLPGLDVTGPVLDVRVSTLCWQMVLDPDTNYDVAVDATFDNFEFVKGDAGVIPEPLTIFSAMLAVGGLGAYIRRRNASAS